MLPFARAEAKEEAWQLMRFKSPECQPLRLTDEFISKETLGTSIAYHGQAKEAKDADEAAGETQPSEAPNFVRLDDLAKRIS